jgi:hypothetical protein
MKYEVFIAIGDSAKAYAENFNVNELEQAINESYAPSLRKFEFDTLAEKKAFQDALEFCGYELGCGDFYVIDDNDVNNNRELINSLV